MDISDCETVHHIIAKLNKIVEASRQPGKRRKPKVEFGLRVLTEVVDEPCPICVERMDVARIIQPCFHVICATCLQKLQSNTCPFCRQGIESTLSSSEAAHALNSAAQPSPPGAPPAALPTSFGEAFEQIIKGRIPDNDGSFTMQAAMRAVLLSLRESHDGAGGGTLRVVVVCAQVDLNATGFEAEGYEVIRRADSTGLIDMFLVVSFECFGVCPAVPYR